MYNYWISITLDSYIHPNTKVRQEIETEFSACIIDEAGQLVEAETSIILQVWVCLCLQF